MTYVPRPQFIPFHERGERWAIMVCHRRAGKTVACVNELIRAASLCERTRPRFAYIAPHLNQAKDIAWTYLRDYSEDFDTTRKVNESETRAVTSVVANQVFSAPKRIHQTSARFSSSVNERQMRSIDGPRFSSSSSRSNVNSLTVRTATSPGVTGKIVWFMVSVPCQLT